MSVFYDVHAVTAAASVSDNFLYHLRILTYHLLFCHYRSGQHHVRHLRCLGQQAEGMALPASPFAALSGAEGHWLRSSAGAEKSRGEQMNESTAAKNALKGVTNVARAYADVLKNKVVLKA